MKKFLLLTTFAALTTAACAQESKIYVCKGQSYHVYSTAKVDGISFDKADNPTQVYISNGTDRHAYDALAVDSFTFAKPTIKPGKQATDRIYASETFATDFGAFTVRTVKGLSWVIDYSSAKASGYANKTTTPSESYLLSEAYDMTEATGATLTFKYVLQYSGSTTKVLITDQYTGDPATTVWTDITDGQISKTKDFSTFSTYTYKIPSRFLGESNVVIALYHSCNGSSSTWEVKNLQLSLDGATPGGGGTDPIPSDDQTNTNKNTKGLDKGADRLEIPKLSDKDLQLFIVKQTSGIDRTYSLEWDCTKKANRWVALQMHDGLPDKSVGRNGGWQDDSDIPSQYQTHDADYKGTPFSRGHMCASSDRQTTVAQNRQTFIMSNIHPQYQNHNGNLWQTLETQVQKWGYSSVYRDTLYVVKAGTIDKEDQILTRTSSGLTVPKYFYMAILCVKDGKYKALAFWTEHTNTVIKNPNPRDYAISIKELESKTGIDFFCNLPDKIEQEVEQNYNPADWSW